MAFIKTPEEIIHREMNPAWNGTGYDFSKLYTPKEETRIFRGENSLQNKSYVDEFLEERVETTIEETKSKEKTYVLRKIIGSSGRVNYDLLDQLEKELEEEIERIKDEEERRRDEEDEFEAWLNEGYFLSGWRT